MLRAVSFNPANVAITGGTIKVNDGTAAAPSYSFANFTGSGFYTFSGNLGFSYNGASRLALGDNLFVRPDLIFGWSSGDPQSVGGDTVFARDAAGVLARRDGTNAQTNRLYNTFTDQNNGEWLEFSWASSVASIVSKANGTGVVRPLVLNAGPVTNTGASYAVLGSDTYLIANVAGTQTLTLGTAIAGRRLVVRTITANDVVSASSNVVPRIGGAAGTAILAAVDGAWAELVGDGTNWQIMASS